MRKIAAVVRDCRRTITLCTAFLAVVDDSGTGTYFHDSSGRNMGNLGK